MKNDSLITIDIQGYNAHLAGKPLTENPHQCGFQEHDLWDFGWLLARWMPCIREMMDPEVQARPEAQAVTIRMLVNITDQKLLECLLSIKHKEQTITPILAGNIAHLHGYIAREVKSGCLIISGPDAMGVNNLEINLASIHWPGSTN